MRNLINETWVMNAVVSQNAVINYKTQDCELYVQELLPFYVVLKWVILISTFCFKTHVIYSRNLLAFP